MFYGWYIVAAVFTSQLFITGFMTYSFGLLVLPLQETFGASRAEVNLAMSAVTLSGLVLSPLFGALVALMAVFYLVTVVRIQTGLEGAAG